MDTTACNCTLLPFSHYHADPNQAGLALIFYFQIVLFSTVGLCGSAWFNSILAIQLPNVPSYFACSLLHSLTVMLHSDSLHVVKSLSDLSHLQTKLLTNQAYDESLEVNDYEEIASVYTPTPRRPVSRKKNRPLYEMANNSSDEFDDDVKPKKKEQRNGQPGLSENEEEEEEEEEDDDSDETESDEEEGEPGSAPEG
ncbi:unnamed protein product [Oncorhynchus mykiss]|uniref:Uncharacterized protein n=1 Tax=Oncorhynchus mykiss TaxID=8022 RepID=A0A060WT14_ONCMY|nr:unnamed protein product [Oncorhynchus mykiss]